MERTIKEKRKIKVIGHGVYKGRNFEFVIAKEYEKVYKEQPFYVVFEDEEMKKNIPELSYYLCRRIEPGEGISSYNQNILFKIGTTFYLLIYTPKDVAESDTIITSYTEAFQKAEEIIKEEQNK